MSRPAENAGVKRKRPASNSVVDALIDADRAVLDVIKGKEDMGIWARDIKRETKLPDNVVNKSIKSLEAKKLIKEVKNIQFKGKKHYMAAEFEPSKEVSGGVWYAEGALDKGLIDALKRFCLRIVCSQKVATADGLCSILNKNKVTTFDCSQQQVVEILNSMVLDNQIMEVKSTGLGEYHSIPVGKICYRAISGDAVSKGPKLGIMATIPCGMCPRISQCTPDGIISPATCVYYQKWLEF